MVGCTWFSNFVSGVWEDLGQRSDYSLGYLSGWFLDSSNIGLVNAQIDTCHQLTGYTDISGNLTGLCIVPEMNNGELAIFKSNFDVFFYSREGKLVLSGAAGVNSWTNLREGDSSITQVNRSELARTYNIMMKDSRSSLKDLVRDYLRNANRPQAVFGDDTIWGGFYGYNNGNWRRRDWS